MSAPKPAPETSADSADLPPKLAEADIAFLKSLVSEGPSSQSVSGRLLFVGGLVYAMQCFAYVVIWLAQLEPPGWAHLVLSFVPTVIFMVELFRTLWKRRKKGGEKGVAQRALNAAFTATGLTNMCLIIIFLWLAWKRQDHIFWFLYSIMVCAGQGAAWYIAYMIRKRLWLAFVSAGWFIAALGMGFFIENTLVYVAIIGTALLLCMALPGWVLMKSAKEA